MKETPLINENLLRLLVCPATGGELKLEANRLVSNIGGIFYKIEDGIPVMLMEQTTPNPYS